jgi:CheY-like chemotaxis protein
MARLKILVAEDNRGDVFLMREALLAHGIEHDLFVIQDGAEALAYMERMGKSPDAPCPDVFLLDLNLPKVEGHQLLARFRGHPLCRDTPVIVVTSSDAQRDRERAALLGAARYCRKPSDIDEFMQLGAVIKEGVHRTPV